MIAVSLVVKGVSLMAVGAALLTGCAGGARADGPPSPSVEQVSGEITVSGADGYRAALAWAEASPELSMAPVLVAYTEDGLPLEQPTLVVSGDLGGARYVRDVVDLRIINLARQ